MLFRESLIDLIRKPKQPQLLKKWLQPSIQTLKYLFSTNFQNKAIVKSFKPCLNQNIGIIGAPFADGQTKPGVNLGPKYIREGGLIKMIQNIHETINIKDYGDIIIKNENNENIKHPGTKNMLKLNNVACFTQMLSDRCCKVLSDQRMCITLGGDHSIAIGTIDGHLRYDPNIAIIWVDAHADLNTNATSPTGNIHGMPVALLVKELTDYWPYIPGMDWQKPIISVKDLVYIGLRSVDDYERLIIEKFGVHAFGIREIDLYGIKKVFEMAMERVDPENKKHLHISFDIDALDEFEAPSTGTSVRGGLTLREGIYIMEEAYKTGRLDAFDMVEVNPSIGTEKDVKNTINAAIELIKAGCGHQRIGNIANVKDIPLL